MSNYNIEIKVEISKTENEITEGYKKRSDGSFGMVISGEQGQSIDQCEQSLLSTNYPAIRDALAQHLSQLSKEEASNGWNSYGFVKKNTKVYSVEGEVGRFSFETYSLVNAFGEEWYNTAREFFPPLQGTESYRTEGFNEIALIYGTVEESFRKTSKLVNRVRHQEKEGTPSRTLKDYTEKEGTQIQRYLHEKTLSILEEHGFTSEGQVGNLIVGDFSANTVALEDEELGELVNSLDVENRFKSSIVNNPVAYENAEDSINMSIDDVGAKQQKETRESKNQEKTDGKARLYVQNTVVHVQKGKSSYVLNGYGVIWTLQLLLAFLLNNHLIGQNWMFFVDGHGLYSKVIKFFAWHKKIGVILDWFHLEKKCKERLSMALNGSKIRNEVLAKLMPLLWHGVVDEAILYLKHLPPELIRNQKEIQSLIDYFEKNKPMIPVYAIRKKLGLRNSSNLGEKANDLLVANRQKHEGMAWSKSGSVTLTFLTALKKNSEHKTWFHERKIEFKLAS